MLGSGDTASEAKTAAAVHHLLMLIPALRSTPVQCLSQYLAASLAGLPLQPGEHHEERFDAMATAVQRIVDSIGSQVITLNLPVGHSPQVSQTLLPSPLLAIQCLRPANMT